jgi:4-azaleucine resistance transporter AzlC
MKTNTYRAGLNRGLPVGIGYFSVSFGFGAMAANLGVRALDAALISLTNFTSAGQFAGLTLMVASASLWEVLLTQIVINSRYALMGLSLSQRLGPEIRFWQRIGIAFFNSDEIFALAMAEPGHLTAPFLFGLGTMPILGWAGGTLMGALAGSLLPLGIRSALGVMLYGMFIAIVIPPAKKEKPVLLVAMLSLVFSCLLTWVPGLKNLSSGISIVLCTVAAASIGAIFFPVEESKE